MTFRSELNHREVDFLFRPWLGRKLALPSRLVMAPLDRGLAQNGIPAPGLADFYRRRAENGVGLIITGVASVREAVAAPHAESCVFHGGTALRVWRRVAEAVHGTPCRLAVQLMHAGMFREVGLPGVPLSPSGLSPRGGSAPMSRGQMAQVRTAYAEAAAAAKALGFDAVELYAGPESLPGQFLSAVWNRREDEYGGDLLGRCRLACEILHAMRRAVGPRYPLLLRFCPAQLVESVRELAELLVLFRAAGADVFDVSAHEAGQPAFVGSPLSWAGWVQYLSGCPTIACGGVGVQPGALERAVQKLSVGEFSLLAAGRALLAEPQWGTLVRLGRENEAMPLRLG